MAYKFYKLLLISFILSFISGTQALADEWYCEVMTVSGTAWVTGEGKSQKPIKEGDLLSRGDQIETETKSYVDLAFDKGWNNLTRLRENTVVQIRSIFPTDIYMKKGDVIAKLDALPRNSTYEVKTPTAIAAVRGSEFRTTHEEIVEETNVFNYAESPVLVFGLDEQENIIDPVVLQEFEKTEVLEREPPAPPAPMTPEEIAQRNEMHSKMETKIQEAVDEGREANLPSMEHIEEQYNDKLEDRIENIVDTGTFDRFVDNIKEPEESKVDEESNRMDFAAYISDVKPVDLPMQDMRDLESREMSDDREMIKNLDTSFGDKQDSMDKPELPDTRDGFEVPDDIKQELPEILEIPDVPEMPDTIEIPEIPDIEDLIPDEIQNIPEPPKERQSRNDDERGFAPPDFCDRFPNQCK